MKHTHIPPLNCMFFILLTNMLNFVPIGFYLLFDLEIHLIYA